MKLSKQVAWLNKKSLSGMPQTFEIVSFAEIETDKGIDKQLTLKQGNVLKKMSIYGDGLNKLIDLFGDDSDKWAGKKVQLHTEQNVPSGKEWVLFT